MKINSVDIKYFFNDKGFENESCLMKHDFVSRMERVQTSPNSRLDTCMNEETASVRMVTGVVSATMPPMSKSELESVL